MPKVPSAPLLLIQIGVISLPFEGIPLDAMLQFLVDQHVAPDRLDALMEQVSPPTARER